MFFGNLIENLIKKYVETGLPSGNIYPETGVWNRIPTERLEKMKQELDEELDSLKDFKFSRKPPSFNTPADLKSCWDTFRFKLLEKGLAFPIDIEQIIVKPIEGFGVPQANKIRLVFNFIKSSHISIQFHQVQYRAHGS